MPAPTQLVIRVLRQDAHHCEIVGEVRVRADRTRHDQLAQVIDERAQLLGWRLVFESGKVKLLRCRHQPDARLHHDAQIRLRKQAVEVGPDTPFVGVTHRVVAGRAAAGFEQAAIGQDDIHATQAAEMVGHRRESAALVQGIAHHARILRRARGVGPQARAGLLQVVVDLLVGHARFNDGEPELLIDLADAIHPLQHHRDSGVVDRRLLAVTEVLAGADRPDGHVGLQSRLDHSLNLRCRAGVDDDRRQCVKRQAGARGAFDGLGVADDAVGPDDGHQCFEQARIHTRRRGARAAVHHVTTSLVAGRAPGALDAQSWATNSGHSGRLGRVMRRSSSRKPSHSMCRFTWRPR